MSKLSQRINESKQSEVEKLIASKLASGKFVNTGKTYNASEAQADATNDALRLTAHLDSNNNLVWSK